MIWLILIYCILGFSTSSALAFVVWTAPGGRAELIANWWLIMLLGIIWLVLWVLILNDMRNEW